MKELQELVDLSRAIAPVMLSNRCVAIDVEYVEKPGKIGRQRMSVGDLVTDLASWSAPTQGRGVIDAAVVTALDPKAVKAAAALLGPIKIGADARNAWLCTFASVLCDLLRASRSK